MESEDLTAADLAAFPQFSIPVRPSSVPTALLALDRGTKVWYDHGTSCGISGSGLANAGNVVQEYEERIARQRRNQFHPDEAAHLVAEAQDFNSRAFRKSMEKAFRAGALKVRAPDTEVPRESADAWRPASDIVTVSDLDAWLKAEGMSYRFPSSTSITHSKPPSAGQLSDQRTRRASEKARADPSSSPTSPAIQARWGHLDDYRAAAVNAARSKSFPSRAEAAKHAAEQLQPKPKPKSKPTAPDSYYPWTKVDEWLKAAGWRAKMSWADWVAFANVDAGDGDKPA